MTKYHHPVIFLDTTDSTNLFAHNLINTNEAVHGMVIQAGYQTKGQGQRNKQWLSTEGLNLTFSIILFPADLAVERHFELNQVFSLGIYDFLKDKGIAEINVKWPNDIMVSGKKIAGILMENTIRGKFINSIIAGVGINVNQQFFEGEYAIEPVSLSTVLCKTLQLPEALQELLTFILFRYDQLASGKTAELNNDYHNTLFKRYQLSNFKSGDEIWSGIINGVSEDGELIVEDETGKLKNHSFGEIKMVF